MGYLLCNWIELHVDDTDEQLLPFSIQKHTLSAQIIGQCGTSASCPVMQWVVWLICTSGPSCYYPDVYRGWASLQNGCACMLTLAREVTP